MKEELTIEIVITDYKEVKGQKHNARMISFEGSCNCENFKGKVLPGGVDTQKDIPGEPSSLSARYMLEGVDRDGRECHIFIENNGICDEEGMRTIPVIYTDSSALAYLEEASLTGTVEPCENGVQIHIYSNM